MQSCQFKSYFLYKVWVSERVHFLLNPSFGLLRLLRMQHDITSTIRPRIRTFMHLHHIWALFKRASFLRFYAVFISHFKMLTRCIREWTDLQRLLSTAKDQGDRTVCKLNIYICICIKNGQNIMKNNYIWTMEKGSSRLHCTMYTDDETMGA